MKTQLLSVLQIVLLLLIPMVNFAQAPYLGTASGFVLFSSIGAVGNSGISKITGNVGTNNGSITGFGNVNGVMSAAGSGTSAQCAADLLIAYNMLNSAVPAFFPTPLLGNGQTLIAGVYSISGAATLNGILKLDAQGNPGGVFIFKIQGPFSTAAASKVQLINGAMACNVFWKVEGLVSMATGTTMRGTVIANNAAINMSTGDTLEGRAMSTTGAVNVQGVMAYTPVGCGSPVLTGPAAPALATTQCYTLFSSNGPVSNAGATYVSGDVGTNAGLTTGFNPLLVTGTIHPIPDGSTLQCAADLGIVYNYLNAMGYSNAVFVIKINGALSTNTYSRVVLINGAQAKNVYWKVDGAVSINDYSVFKGTIICNNGAILLKTGVNLEGRALSTTGALGTTAITANMPAGASIATGAGTTTITVNFGGTATSGKITVAGNSSCGNGQISPDFNVNINAIPPAAVVTLSGTVMTSSASSGNQWYFNGAIIPGATGQTYTAMNFTGNYWCVVTLNGCPSDISNKVWVQMVGITEIPANVSFNIYPIPNNGQFTVSITNPVDLTCSIRIYDQLGGTIFERRDVTTVDGKYEAVIDLRPASFFTADAKAQRKIVLIVNHLHLCVSAVNIKSCI
ncbi:MAG: ice-binding family protein [Bacteroidales bacterium]|nr:ice-binding family protein [Bacteroidales bacterium]